MKRFPSRTEAEILREIDGNRENCMDVEDCAAEGLMCHDEMRHWMTIKADSSEDTRTSNGKDNHNQSVNVFSAKFSG